MKLASRKPSPLMSSKKLHDSDDFLRRFERALATRYAREHLMKNIRRADNSPQIFRPRFVQSPIHIIRVSNLCHRMDMLDDPRSTVVTASLELPGLKPNEISIQLQDEKLTVSGERVSQSQNPGATYPVQEMKYGTFRRIIDLPPGVLVRSASLKNY
jgi:HSP20 family molecular chaperone IbpA